MSVALRNVVGSLDDPVEHWPYEALVAVIERGLVADWRPILAEIARAPWGAVAYKVAYYATYGEDQAVDRLFALAIDRARERARERERDEVASRVKGAIESSGMTRAAFARQVGTSASRLSTYENGRVVPSAAMLVRIEAAARSDK